MAVNRLYRLSCQKTGGFTMMEFVIVLVAVGILASAAMIRLDSNVLVAPVALDRLRGHVQLMQLVAMRQNTLCRVTFAADQYTLSCANGNIPGLAQTTYEIPNGVALTASASTLSFNAMGVPCNDVNALTPIVTLFQVRIAGGTHNLSFRLTPQTGYITN